MEVRDSIIRSESTLTWSNVPAHTESFELGECGPENIQCDVVDGPVCHRLERLRDLDEGGASADSTYERELRVLLKGRSLPMIMSIGLARTYQSLW